MPSRKIGLLIASPFGGLQGPLNDVNRMEGILDRQGFEIIRRYGEKATYDEIIDAWRTLPDICSPSDTVVIYYSGHGGLVESSEISDKPNTEKQKSRRYQFLVPIDFHETEVGDFRGILDVQISHLLRDLTNVTKNVTIILDCCHSGRMARDPAIVDAKPRSLSKVLHYDIPQRIKRLQEDGSLHGETHLEGNQDAVRVVAAATAETAWEYRGSAGQSVGAMTEALAAAIEESVGHKVSWRTTLLRVSELVNVRFAQQHPQVEGPDTRLHFSLEKSDFSPFFFKIEDSIPVIYAGRVSGVREGNVYSLMPLDSVELNSNTHIGNATVTRVIGFKAMVELSFDPNEVKGLENGALAFLREEALYKWSINIAVDSSTLRGMVDASKYLRSHLADDLESPLMEIRHQGEQILLLNSFGFQVASQNISKANREPQAFAQIIESAEQLAKAQHLERLACENSAEILDHNIEITFGIVEHGKEGRTIQQDGTGHVTEKEPIYIKLKNDGASTVYVTLFDINVRGNISWVSNMHARGIELRPTKSYTIGEDQWGMNLKGLHVSWPKDFPKFEQINERLVFIISSSPMDLGHLARPPNTSLKGRNNMSSLEQFALRLSTGGSRDIVSNSRSLPVQYDTHHIPFSLRSRSNVALPAAGPSGINSSGSDQYSEPSAEEQPTQVLATTLPAPEDATESENLPQFPPHMEKAGRGALGAFIRTVTGVPPCVWVVNEHDSEITVVVSKYRPNRLLTNVAINASITGGGLEFGTTTFTSPATKKTLKAQSQDKEASIGVFPLWTRQEGFGVISIFVGENKVLFTENAQIPLGSTAYFSNKPNLRIVLYGGQTESVA